MKEGRPMRTNKKDKQANYKLHRVIIVALLMLAFAMSSSTFSYWASYVDGANSSYNTNFKVGSTTFQDYDFIINSEDDQGEFLIDDTQLIIKRRPTGESIDVLFGINWEDKTTINEDGTVTTAKIKLSYRLYAEKNGVEVRKYQYKRLNSMLEIDFGEENSEFITLNGGTQSFGMNISIDQNLAKWQYKLLERSDVTIIVTYEIIYTTTEAIE